MTTSTQTTVDRFREKFVTLKNWWKTSDDYGEDASPDKVLAFIEEELSRQKEKMIEALPEERPAEFYKDASDEMKGEMRGWNEYRKEVIASLSDKGE